MGSGWRVESGWRKAGVGMKSEDPGRKADEEDEEAGSEGTTQKGAQTEPSKGRVAKGIRDPCSPPDRGARRLCLESRAARGKFKESDGSSEKQWGV